MPAEGVRSAGVTVGCELPCAGATETFNYYVTFPPPINLFFQPNTFFKEAITEFLAICTARS